MDRAGHAASLAPLDSILHQIPSLDAQVFVDQAFGQQIRWRVDEHNTGFSKRCRFMRLTGEDLRAALDAVLTGRPLSSNQKPSIGCNIKWKPGNEPAYFAS